MDKLSLKRTRQEVLLMRGLKRSKLFQIQKITRNIRLLKNKKGNEAQLERNKRKHERLAQELEIIKDTNINELSQLLKARDETIVQILDSIELPLDISIRAKWRLLHSKAMKQVLIDLNYFSTQNDLESTNKASVAKALNSKEIFNEQDDSITYEIDDKRELESVSYESKKLSSSIHVSKGVDRTEASSTRSKSLFSRNTQHRHIEPAEPTPANKLDSVFVDLLSDTNRQKSKPNMTKLNRKMSKNRVGQRERRKIWEQIYGNKARHLRMSMRGKRQLITKHSLLKSSKPPNIIKQPKQERIKEVLHPSWEASRKRKAMEKIQQSFEGKHILFSDSD